MQRFFDLLVDDESRQFEWSQQKNRILTIKFSFASIKDFYPLYKSRCSIFWIPKIEHLIRLKTEDS